MLRGPKLKESQKSEKEASSYASSPAPSLASSSSLPMPKGSKLNRAKTKAPHSSPQPLEDLRSSTKRKQKSSVQSEPSAKKGKKNQHDIEMENGDEHGLNGHETEAAEGLLGLADVASSLFLAAKEERESEEAGISSIKKLSKQKSPPMKRDEKTPNPIKQKLSRSTEKHSNAAPPPDHNNFIGHRSVVGYEQAQLQRNPSFNPPPHSWSYNNVDQKGPRTDFVNTSRDSPNRASQTQEKPRTLRRCATHVAIAYYIYFQQKQSQIAATQSTSVPAIKAERAVVSPPPSQSSIMTQKASPHSSIQQMNMPPFALDPTYEARLLKERNDSKKPLSHLQTSSPTLYPSLTNLNNGAARLAFEASKAHVPAQFAQQLQQALLQQPQTAANQLAHLLPHPYLQGQLGAAFPGINQLPHGLVQSFTHPTMALPPFIAPDDNLKKQLADASCRGKQPLMNGLGMRNNGQSDLHRVLLNEKLPLPDIKDPHPLVHPSQPIFSTQSSSQDMSSSDLLPKRMIIDLIDDPPQTQYERKETTQHPRGEEVKTSSPPSTSLPTSTTFSASLSDSVVGDRIATSLENADKTTEKPKQEQPLLVEGKA